MTEIKRLEEVRFFLKKEKNEFSTLLGYKYSQNYTSLLSGKTGISLKVINAIKKADSRISIDWLLWGQGSMLLSGTTNNDNKTTNGNNNQTTFNGTINHTSDQTAAMIQAQQLAHLKQRIKDKDIYIKSLEELLASQKETTQLYKDKIATLQQENLSLKQQLKELPEQ
jgi:hypothetical protein